MTFELTPLEVAAAAAILSLLSLLVASMSLGYSHRTYYRAGPRINLQLAALIAGDSFLDVKLVLNVHNSGLAEIDIDSFGMRLLGVAYTIDQPDVVKAEKSQVDLPPVRIKANQTGRYIISLEGPLAQVLDTYRKEFAARSRFSRLVFQFGMLQILTDYASSPWRAVSAVPAILVQLGGGASAELSSMKLARRLWKHVLKHYRLAVTNFLKKRLTNAPTLSDASKTPETTTNSASTSSVDALSEEQRPATD